MTDTQNIVAGVVAFEPDVARLTLNLAAIAPQVGALLLLDNGSSPEVAEAIRGLATRFDATLLVNPTNRGMSGGLNDLCRAALSRGATHLLLLDQDSVAERGLVAALSDAFEPGVVLACPRLVDRNLGGLRVADGEPHDVDLALSSGSLLDLAAWSRVGGYDEELFVDFVDFDLCARLTEAGGRLVCAPAATLVHEVGHGRRVGPFVSYGHSAFRSRFIARDMVLFARKHGGRRRGSSARRSPLVERGVPTTLLIIARRMVVVALFETDRRRRLVALATGAVEGLARAAPACRRASVR